MSKVNKENLVESWVPDTALSPPQPSQSQRPSSVPSSSSSVPAAPPAQGLRASATADASAAVSAQPASPPVIMMSQDYGGSNGLLPMPSSSGYTLADLNNQQVSGLAGWGACIFWCLMTG